MEDYPAEYVEHNLPLILVSGLDEHESEPESARPTQQSGTKLVFTSRACNHARTGPVLEQLKQFDGLGGSRSTSTSAAPLRYRIKTIARSYTLPARNAAPQPQSPLDDPLSSKQGSNELHSPLSPLSPGSPLFPDGIMTPLWFAKHQRQVPALLLAFFDITSEGGAAQDATTKVDINAVKTALTRSGFRVRFAAVLISDKSILQAPELDDRITSIRRATSLDSKNGLFFMPTMSTAEEIAVFVANMLTTLRPVCADYYRELTKHARRKKTRIAVPQTPPTPTLATNQALTASGWNIRYEVKQGVFAEFRQETEVAERHYSQAIYDLCAEDGFYETALTWSIRWDEARLLTDTLAIRVIRSLLRLGSTSSATRSWFEYRDRMRSIMQRKGRGTQSYGWLAWEARWAEVMAQLVHSADLAALDDPLKSKHEKSGTDLLLTHIAAEKALPSFERLPAAQLLHHPGYWYVNAIHYTKARTASALTIPAEDRLPPAQSPASSFARKAETYDTYLVPEPHAEYAEAQIQPFDANSVRLTQRAVNEFAGRGQIRKGDELTLRLGEELMATGQHDQAFEMLVRTWDATHWRQDCWHDLLGKLLMLLHQCAKTVRNADIALATLWELYSLDAVPEAQMSINELLGALHVPDDKRVVLEFQNLERLSPIGISFVIDGSSAHAGEPVRCQLELRNLASSMSAHMKLSHVEIIVTSQPMVILEHGVTQDATASSQLLILERQSAALRAVCDLSIAPGQHRLFDFDLNFRDAEVVRLEKLVLYVTERNFTITQEISDTRLVHAYSVGTTVGNEVVTVETRSQDSTLVEILPKPPKVEMHIEDLDQQYYVSQAPRLHVSIVNQESQPVRGRLRIQAPEQDGDQFGSARISLAPNQDPTFEIEDLTLDAAESADITVHITSSARSADWSALLSIEYTLEGDPETSLSRSIEIPVHFVKLFDLKWSFAPLLYEGDWPSYFSTSQDVGVDRFSGIPQRWRASLQAQLTGGSSLLVRSSKLRLVEDLTDIECVIDTAKRFESEVIQANAITRRYFDLTTQRSSMDDRRPIALDLVCDIEWCLEESDSIQTLSVTVPRVSLPTSEPRVLCTVSPDNTGKSDVVVSYHLENLSTHFLTFAIKMDPSDEFAYSGVKTRTLSLAPLSRVQLSYWLILHDKVMQESKADGRWVSPCLQVIDSYYHKTLEIQPAGTGVKVDKDGKISVWIDR